MAIIQYNDSAVTYDDTRVEYDGIFRGAVALGSFVIFSVYGIAKELLERARAFALFSPKDDTALVQAAPVLKKRYASVRDFEVVGRYGAVALFYESKRAFSLFERMRSKDEADVLRSHDVAETARAADAFEPGRAFVLTVKKA